MAEHDEQTSAPRTADALRFERRAHEPMPGSPAATHLANLISAMYQAGDDADTNYKTALKRLRERPAEVVIEIARGERCCHEDDYQTRFALIHAAAEMKHPATLPFLINLVLTPLPAERSSDPHSFSSVAEETILRTRAIEGVGRMAKENREALDALFEFLKQPSLSMRRAAIQSLLAVRRDAFTRKKIAALLPEEHRFLLDLKAVDVREVPQIKNPERQLCKTRHRAAPAPPDFSGEDPCAENDDESGPRTDK